MISKHSFQIALFSLVILSLQSSAFAAESQPLTEQICKVAIERMNFVGDLAVQEYGLTDLQELLNSKKEIPVTSELVLSLLQFCKHEKCSSKAAAIIGQAGFLDNDKEIVAKLIAEYNDENFSFFEATLKNHMKAQKQLSNAELIKVLVDSKTPDLVGHSASIMHLLIYEAAHLPTPSAEIAQKAREIAADPRFPQPGFIYGVEEEASMQLAIEHFVKELVPANDANYLLKSVPEFQRPKHQVFPFLRTANGPVPGNTFKHEYDHYNYPNQLATRLNKKPHLPSLAGLIVGMNSVNLRFALASAEKFFSSITREDLQNDPAVLSLALKAIAVVQNGGQSSNWYDSTVAKIEAEKSLIENSLNAKAHQVFNAHTLGTQSLPNQTWEGLVEPGLLGDPEWVESNAAFYFNPDFVAKSASEREPMMKALLDLKAEQVRLEAEIEVVHQRERTEFSSNSDRAKAWDSAFKGDLKFWGEGVDKLKAKIKDLGLRY